LGTDAAISDYQTWTHVAVVQDGTSPVLYANGVAPAQAFNVQTDKTKWFNGIATLNVGYIGCRNIGSGKASYAIVNISESGINPEIIRLDFDIKKTCDSLLAANLHDYLCQRLFLGR